MSRFSHHNLPVDVDSFGMAIYELCTGPFPYSKVQKRKAKEARLQMPELLLSDPSHPFLIACTVVDIDRVVAWFEEGRRRRRSGWVIKSSVSKVEGKERNPNPEFLSHETFQNLKRGSTVQSVSP
jgi:hypothetical protein